VPRILPCYPSPGWETGFLNSGVEIPNQLCPVGARQKWRRICLSFTVVFVNVEIGGRPGQSLLCCSQNKYNNYFLSKELRFKWGKVLLVKFVETILTLIFNGGEPRSFDHRDKEFGRDPQKTILYRSGVDS
jgi:hypothetical protein